MSKAMEMIDVDLTISRYLAGDATDGEMAALARWVSSSEENKRFFFEQRRVWKSLSPGFTADDIDADAALASLLASGRLEPARVTTGRRRYMQWLRYAAACLIPVSMLLIYQNYIHKPDAGSYPVELNTAYGGRIMTTLPDGSTVWLNSNSSLAYDIPFDTGRRVVTLTGEAYFDVASDRDHPFVVATDGMEVVATGTQFNVNAYPGPDPTMMVTLVEGKVDVTLPSPATSVALSPDKALIVRGGECDVIESGIAKFCTWKDGYLDFRNDELRYIIARLEQIYPVEFEVRDSTLLDRHYYAVFENETIGEIVHLMELSGDLSFTQVSPDRDATTAHAGKLKISVSRP